MPKPRRLPTNIYAAAAIDWYRTKHRGREPPARLVLRWSEQYIEAATALREEAYRRGAVQNVRAPTAGDFDDL